jgi:hypothetical protein
MLFPAVESDNDYYSNGSEVGVFDILVSGSDASVWNYDDSHYDTESSVHVSQV